MTEPCPAPIKGRLLFGRFLEPDGNGLSDFGVGGLNPPLCKVARDLFAGTTAAGTVVLRCNKVHHNDSRAHETVGADGRAFTWR